jgi:hypothetical protein
VPEEGRDGESVAKGDRWIDGGEARVPRRILLFYCEPSSRRAHPRCLAGGWAGGREGETQSIRNCEDDGKNNKHKGAP